MTEPAAPGWGEADAEGAEYIAATAGYEDPSQAGPAAAGDWGDAYAAAEYGEAEGSGWETGVGEATGGDYTEDYGQWTEEPPRPGESGMVYSTSDMERLAAEPPASPLAEAPPAEEAEAGGGDKGASKLARLAQRVRDQQQRIRRMEQQAMVDGQKIHDLREALAKKDTEIAGVHSTLEWHKRELAALKSEAAEICKGAVLAWQIRAEQAERALDEAQRALRQREQEAAAGRLDLEEAEATNRRRVEKLQEEVAEGRQEAEMLRASLTKVEQQYTDAATQLREREDEVKKLQEEVWRHQEDILTLQRQNQELGESGLQAKFKAKLEEAERCHRRALDVMTQRMLQEIEQLKQELEQAAAEKEQLLRHQEDFRTFLKPSMRGVVRPPAPTAPSEAALKPPPEGKGEGDLQVQWDYLRRVVLQFLQNSDPDFRRRVLPILATVLKLDDYELQGVYLANRQWVAEPEYTGCGAFFTSFLRPADH